MTVDGYKAKERYHEPSPADMNAEEFRKVVESRRSVRKFTDRKIPREVLDGVYFPKVKFDRKHFVH